MSPAASAKQLCARSRPAEASARRLRWRLKPPEAGESPLGVGGAAGAFQARGAGGDPGWEGEGARGGAGVGRRASRSPARGLHLAKVKNEAGAPGHRADSVPAAAPGPAKCTRGRTRSDNYRTRSPVSWGRRGGDAGGGRAGQDPGGPAPPWASGICVGVREFLGVGGTEPICHLPRSLGSGTPPFRAYDREIPGAHWAPRTSGGGGGGFPRGRRGPRRVANGAALYCELRAVTGKSHPWGGRIRRVPVSHSRGQLWPAHRS